MKKINSFLTLALLGVGSLTLSACADDEEDCRTELEAMYENIEQKSDAFMASPTRSNCTSYQTAVRDFANKAKECGNADMKEDADDLLATINSLDCSGF